MEGVPTDVTHNFIADVRWGSTGLDGMQLAMRPFTVDGKGVAVISYVQAVPQTPWPRIRASAPQNRDAETVPSPQITRAQPLSDVRRRKRCSESHRVPRRPPGQNESSTGA
jgi:hypothetical protein